MAEILKDKIDLSVLLTKDNEIKRLEDVARHSWHMSATRHIYL